MDIEPAYDAGLMDDGKFALAKVAILAISPKTTKSPCKKKMTCQYCQHCQFEGNKGRKNQETDKTDKTDRANFYILQGEIDDLFCFKPLSFKPLAARSDLRLFEGAEFFF